MTSIGCEVFCPPSSFFPFLLRPSPPFTLKWCFSILYFFRTWPLTLRDMGPWAMVKAVPGRVWANKCEDRKKKKIISRCEKCDSHLFREIVHKQTHGHTATERRRGCEDRSEQPLEEEDMFVWQTKIQVDPKKKSTKNTKYDAYACGVISSPGRKEHGKGKGGKKKKRRENTKRGAWVVSTDIK